MATRSCPDDTRSQAQDRFIGGAARVVVATNAFGMGIDNSDVRSVIHHDLLGPLEANYQEAGGLAGTLADEKASTTAKVLSGIKAGAGVATTMAATPWPPMAPGSVAKTAT